MASNLDKRTVSAADLKALLAEKPETILIDLLSPDHFACRHIPGAQNACVFQVSFLDDLAAVVQGKQTSIVVYGSSERSRDAAAALEKLDRAGYQQVLYLEGGLKAWHGAGYGLEGEAADRHDDPQTTVTLPNGQYTIDPAASELAWAGRNPNSRHVGTVDISQGVIDIGDGTITGTVEIDMNTIHNINLEGDELQPILEAHLRSDDFFFTKMFPTAVFTVKQANRIEPCWLTALNYHVEGELKLRGVSADLDFDATVAPIENSALSFEAHFDIDRTRWALSVGC